MRDCLITWRVKVNALTPGEEVRLSWDASKCTVQAVAVIEVEMTKETLEPGRTREPREKWPAEEKEGQRCSLHV